jgi:pimeloyl-ACP methyl ester carboxylesterase
MWGAVLLIGALFLSAPVQGRDEDAVRKAYEKKLAKLKAEDAGGHYRLAQWCKRMKLAVEAKALFEKVLTLDPNHSGSRRELGYVKVDGQWVTRIEKDRIEYREKLAKLKAEDGGGHYGLGLWCKRKGLFAEAKAQFEKVLELDPKHKGAAKELKDVSGSVLEGVLARYVAAEKEKRKELLKAIRAQDRIDPEQISRLVRCLEVNLRKLPRHTGKEVEMTRHPKFSSRYRVMGNTKGSKLSLLLLLHGGGPSSEVNDGAWEGYKNLRGTPFDIVATPRVWDNSTGAGWVMESGPLVVMTMLHELLRAYDIDTNRVYLAGSSMGGYGTSWIGSLEPDRFAAAGIIAAGYGGGGSKPANLLHVPMTCHIGEKDHASDHIGTARRLRTLLEGLQKEVPGKYVLDYNEYAGMGHSLGREAYHKAFKWMSQFQRDPAPKQVIWEPFQHRRYVTHKTYYYWLKIENGHSKMRMEAKIKADNTIEVTTQAVPAFTLFLNDRLVDLKLPVKVVVNGEEKFNAVVPTSLSAVVESMIAKEDKQMVFTARIDFPN